VPGPAARERKLASVLFADLVGSTELGSSLDPEHTRDLLDRFYEAMASEIALGGGTVEKFIGDAVVAVFGVPVAYEDHAERALSVALWMQRRLHELFGERLALRIGVNTGEVVVGRPREGSSFVTGDAVNVTARLEQAARPGQVLAGERTAALAGDAFEFGDPQTVEAKGKEGGVPCRELLRMVADRRSRPESAFVGRRDELAHFGDQLHKAAEAGRPRLLTLVGEPGIGKTSLVTEFRERLPPTTQFRLGRCLSYGRGVTYSPLADVLRAELGVRQEDPPEVVLAKLGDREILGLTLGLDVGGGLDPRAAGQRLRDEWVSLLSELTAEGPSVVVIEDLHWAADPLVELLQLVLEEVDGPLLLLVTARPEGSARLNGGTPLTLLPLADEEAHELVERVLGAPLDDTAEQLVLRQAGGNPFFLEELLAGLIERQLLRRRNGSWTLDRDTRDLGVPDTVQALLAARIDQLPSSAKEALGAAAAIGRSFSPAGLAALVGTAAEVRTLVERGFVRPTEPELVFKHALTREVAYHSVPKARRARLHASYADWLEQQGTEATRAGVLAYHFSEAVNPAIAELAWRGEAEQHERLRSKALHWLRRAAELAVGRFDLDEAVALLRRAVELAPDDWELFRQIGRASALRFDGESFWEAMQTAIDLTAEPTVLGDLYAELAFESTMRGGMWVKHPDPALIESWFDRALELAAPGGRARAQGLITKTLYTDDVETGDEAIAIAEALRDAELTSYAYWARSGTAFVTHEYAAAHELARRRFTLLDRLTDPDKIAHIHYYGATAALAAGKLDEADTLVRRHDAIASRLSPHHEVHALGVLLMIEEALGHWGEIRQLQARTERAVADNEGTPCVLSPRSLLSCAVACAELGLEAEASRLESKVAGLGFEGYDQHLHPLMAQLALLRGDLAKAQELLDESGDTWLWSMDASLHGCATRLDTLVALGRSEEADLEASRLVQPGTYLEPFALRTLGLVRGDDALVQGSIDRFEALGLDWHAARTRELARG
jgi:class 3 adenylate cyclase